MTSKFKTGESVFYPHLGKYGVIKAIINFNDPEDVYEQGVRYEVAFNNNKDVWSILETSLIRRKKTNEIFKSDEPRTAKQR
jgi:hypothetical protein